MKIEDTKKETVEAIDKMIEYSDKGPSGFWTEDYEGCGNPEIFPEFDEGLKHGKLVQKKHTICPWNQYVLYGNARGENISRCYYHCAINDARFLSASQIQQVLRRFRKRLIAGYYDSAKSGKYAEALLVPNEIASINNHKAAVAAKEKTEHEKVLRENKAKASSLIEKFPDLSEIIVANYGSNTVLMTEGGSLDFSADKISDIIGGERLTYNEYLEAQINSRGKSKGGFEMCFRNIGLSYKGQIDRITSDKICFKRIYIKGMFPDGEMFDGKEDHVWMDKDGFEDFKKSDCVAFSAEVYRYLKTGNGKQIDYALRNPSGIKKINQYDLPSDEELTKQSISWIICETCSLNEQCNRVTCFRNKEEIKQLEKDMLSAVMKDKKGDDDEQ